ncbi:hypothetical protein V1514DRAFT_327559 [Lipomyces japonicus]|uniref:uncharacterized protein n=1 Tax=Lipomyces japonicus TaxID=56871 RepID=UPI0034CFA4B0
MCNDELSSQKCAICLGELDLSKLATTVPCGHSYDLVCLSQWLRVAPAQSCPLCKTEVRSILVNGAGIDTVMINVLSFRGSPHHHHHHHDVATNSRQRQNQHQHEYVSQELDQKYALALSRRRFVYRNGLRACHLGCNRYSQFKPYSINRYRADQARCKSFIRRELAVFPFLLFDNPYDREQQQLHMTSRAWPSTTSKEIEFLTVYIIAMLDLVDLQSVKGHEFAHKILLDYLGAKNASIFIHELCQFLRSSCKSVGEYDTVAQYMLAGSGYGHPLTSLNSTDIEHNLRHLSSDCLEQIPRAYRLRELKCFS